MIKLAIIIIEHIKLFLHPVIINAFVFYQNNKRIKHENWGDDINYYFLREIIKSPVVLFNRLLSVQTETTELFGNRLNH